MKKNKNNSAEVNAPRSLASKSLILFLLDKLSLIIYNAFKNGFFGYIFTAYSKEQESFDNGFIKKHFSEHSKIRHYFRAVKKYFSRTFENSSIINKMRRFCEGVVSIPLRALGSLLFSFGLYVTIIYLIRLFLPVIASADVSVAIVGIVVCIVSIPMLLSSDNVASAVGTSRIFGAVFRDIFGFRNESFEAKKNNSRGKNNIMIILGMLLGVLTLVIHPLTILTIILLLVVLTLIFISPEIGIILALFSIPFFSFFEIPAIILGLLVLTVFLSYLVKLIRGKRILKFEIMDIAVLIFGSFIAFSDTITAGGMDGFREVLLSTELILGYFLVVNLMRTEKWIKRCILALVSSGTIVSFVGIIQYFSGRLPSGAWLDTEYFYDIEGRAVSLFDNPNILATYLVIVLPFAMYALLKASGGKAKFLGVISILSILLCIILTWSRAAWLAAIACVILFMMIYSRKTLVFLFVSMLFIPIVPFFLPNTVMRRFMSIGSMADSSTSYRFYTWKGTLRACSDFLWGGVGYGPTAYQEMYPQYAYAGMEAAEHSHSLYLQILFGVGIFGLLAFFVVIFFFMQMNWEFIKTPTNKSLKMVSAACICAIVGMLIFGLFDFIWFNYRIFFLFWVVIALGCAGVRIGNEETRKHSYGANLDTL